MKIHKLSGTSKIDFAFPKGFSFFEPYLMCFAKEILEVGGEAYLSRTAEGADSGLFLYDDSEGVGSIYAKSRKVFDFFYGLKPFNYLFAEMDAEAGKEIYDIYTLNMDGVEVSHGFSYEIAMAEPSGIAEVEQFMVLTNPKINRRWVNVALLNGDRCFLVRLGHEIAGLGWVSLVGGVGRLHSLFVLPQYRRLGIGKDILNARLMWLKSKRARFVFTEISRLNIPSAGNVTKAGMRVSGQLFQYYRKDLDKKMEPKKQPLFSRLRSGCSAYWACLSC